MAQAHTETREREVVTTVDETVYVLTLTKDEALALMGRLSAGNCVPHGINWRDDVYHRLSDLIIWSPENTARRELHAEIDCAFRRNGAAAALAIAKRGGLPVE